MRLIDADALIEKCGEWYTEEGSEEGFIGTLKQLLDKQPTVKPKRGEWIGEGDGYADGGIVYDAWYCSNCDHCEEGEKLALPNFCPNCGAKMKGTDDE